MNAQWIELKNNLYDLYNDSKEIPGFHMNAMMYNLVIHQMNEIETKYAWESLKEAGY